MFTVKQRTLKELRRADRDADDAGSLKPASFVDGVRKVSESRILGIRQSNMGATAPDQAQNAIRIRAVRKLLAFFDNGVPEPPSFDWSDVHGLERRQAAMAEVMTPAGWRETMRPLLAAERDRAEATAEVAPFLSDDQRLNYAYAEEVDSLLLQLDTIEQRGRTAKVLLARAAYGVASGR